MNFGNLKTLARAYIPQARASAISDSVLKTIINEGALYIASITGCLKTDKKISLVAEQREYSISQLLDRYLNVDRPGVYWYDGSSWKQIHHKTMKWMDENKPNWRDGSSGDPIYSFIHGNNLNLEPKPDTGGSELLWVYHTQRPSTMTDDSHYPFHLENSQTTELDYLATLSECILLYVESRMLNVLGKKEEAMAKINEFKTEATERYSFIEKDDAVAHSSEMRMKWGRHTRV